MTERVSRAARRMDGLAVLILALGLAMYAYSYWGMRQIIAGRIVADPGHLLVEKADHYRRLGNLGLAVAGGGLVVAIASALRHSRRKIPDSP